MNCELPDVPEGMLIRRSMIRAEELRRRILHEVDTWQRMCGSRFSITQQSEINVLQRYERQLSPTKRKRLRYLEYLVFDRFVSGSHQSPDSEEGSYPDIILRA